MRTFLFLTLILCACHRSTPAAPDMPPPKVTGTRPEPSCAGLPLSACIFVQPDAPATTEDAGAVTEDAGAPLPGEDAGAAGDDASASDDAAVGDDCGKESGHNLGEHCFTNR
jgi:hypothetical protein